MSDQKEQGLLYSFIEESFHIEGIGVLRDRDIDAHTRLLAAKSLTVEAVRAFCWDIAEAPLRSRFGLDCSVGNHTPPEGGPHVETRLSTILDAMNAARGNAESAHSLHMTFLDLHPFMDGNGRTSRALWLWMRRGDLDAGLFLKRWYFDSLSYERGDLCPAKLKTLISG